VSFYTKTQLERWNQIHPQKTTVLYPCLDPLIFPLTSTPSHKATTRPTNIVLTVARLDTKERYKGVDQVIRVLPRLREKVPNICYQIVGDGSAKKSLQELAKKLGVTNNVQFCGRVDSDVLVDYYERCSVFVMPSLREGFGIVFLEAAYYKKPVIGGNHGGTPEIIEHGSNGFLVNHDDSNSLVQCLETLLLNQVLQHDMGQRAYEKTTQQFSYQAFLQQFTTLIAPWVTSRRSPGCK